MNLLPDSKRIEAIAKEIHSDKSPVGIDAKKTHLIIIEKLLAIEERLERIEEKISD